MAEDQPLQIVFDGEDPLIVFPAESITVSRPITRLGGSLYRLDRVPLGVEAAAYLDVIEAEPGEDGRLRFIRVVEPSGWRTHELVVQQHMIEGERADSLLQEVKRLGGHWEIVFGGMLIVCLPPGIECDPATWKATA